MGGLRASLPHGWERGLGLRCSQSGSGVTHLELENERKADSSGPESGPHKPSTVQSGAAKPEVCASLPL